jgi:glycosyltransferase involved in cell wall biosynthesis
MTKLAERGEGVAENRAEVWAGASAGPRTESRAVALPVSVIVPVRNEAHNLRRCLESLRAAGEVYVVDSQSTDGTAEIAREFGAQVIQFHYQGGWPKKRQWALDALPLGYEWVLLLDADEAITPELAAEMRAAIEDGKTDGYQVALEMSFLGKRLRRSGATFYKLSLFRRGKGKFECRTQDQDESMCDMEVHEHVMVQGRVGTLKEKIVHYNVESLARYIQKHNEYSNWEVLVWRSGGSEDELQPAFFGTQAQRRRWLRKRFLRLPGSPALFFFYKYILRAGFLDGVPGLIYCGLQGVQFFHIKAKIYESRILGSEPVRVGAELSAAKE